MPGSPSLRNRRTLLRAGALLVMVGICLAACSTDGGMAGSSLPTTSTTAVPPSVTVSPPTATTSLAPSSTTTTGVTLPSTTSTTVPETTTTTRPDWWRPISVEDPLRVWVIGDSLAGPVGVALRALAAGGPVQVTAVDFTRGSGLASPFFLDWPALVATRLPEVAPDVIVCMLGANDGQAMGAGDNRVEFPSAEWETRYGATVGAFMDQLSAGARRVYWVGMPIMADPDYDYRVRHVISSLRAQAGLRLEVRFVDIYRLFEWGPGQFAMELPDEDGNLVIVRAEDGIHFTYEGAERAARYLLDLLLAEWE